MEQSNELEWIWDLRFLENNDIEDDLLCWLKVKDSMFEEDCCFENNDIEDDLLFWLKVKDLLSEDDCCILKLSCFEQSVEHEAVPDWWRVFELGIEEQDSVSNVRDDSLIDEDICFL